MADKVKLGIAFLLVMAGIAGFYMLSDQAAVIRLASILLGFAMAAGVIWTTLQGKAFFGFSRESVAEAKRVVWPTRKETVQTTGMVLIFAVIMALFLWGVDAILLMAVNNLMGRSG